MLKKLAATLLIALCASSASADFLDGTQLLRALRDPQALPFADGYIAGVVDRSRAVTRLSNNTPDGLCFNLPGEVTVAQLTSVVSQWLDGHPQERRYNASGLVRVALSEAFPCKPL
ncbi:Rap1a/Tai family immunity protein [Xylophilus sp.]|uniref:Rap1a/Tai family immunity protein n=1 Tax=Xylophilus sp. TaxID=2653893 RepID=UPI0013B613B8|nr:Rap1a/Tai family immunity protein [Xylophilus sp.]KAF1049316.1 MAG: hypothetical protein GAK38_00772 [Xylophilus sp.]